MPLYKFFDNVPLIVLPKITWKMKELLKCIYKSYCNKFSEDFFFFITAPVWPSTTAGLAEAHSLCDRLTPECGDFSCLLAELWSNRDKVSGSWFIKKKKTCKDN